MDMKALVEDILKIDEAIECVGLIDQDENTLYSKTKDNQQRIITESNEEMYAYYLAELKRMQGNFDNCLGKMKQIQFVRAKTHHFVYLVQNKVIYVICSPITDYEKLFKISNSVEIKIEKSNSSMLYRLPSN